MTGFYLVRRFFYIAAAAAIAITTAPAQDAGKVIEKNDVIYGRADGAASSRRHSVPDR